MPSLREQIGQMLIMGFNGHHLKKEDEVSIWLSSHGLGGVILFDKNLAEPSKFKNLINQDQICQLTSDLRAYSKHPLFISIDYEGGHVDRLKAVEGSIKTKSPKSLANLSESEFIVEIKNMAQQLKALGFNLDFAPVVDLNLTEERGIIGRLGRSFSHDYVKVSRLAELFVSIFAEYGISSCLKHFPGHGSATGDSHEGFVDVSESFQADELEPYFSLLPNHQSKAMVMTAHVINRNLDSSGLPATLSKEILTGILREKIGFEGIIISDDLQMHAISKHYSLAEALSLTINAGADMLIFANQLAYNSATEIVDLIENLVLNSKISAIRIAEAYSRISYFSSKERITA